MEGRVTCEVALYDKGEEELDWYSVQLEKTALCKLMDFTQ